MDKETIKKHINKILQSNGFAKSSINKQLLEYLAEKTIQNEDVKEFTIGEELFNNQDAAVRVYVHNLRKKLNEYYQNEGAEDSIRIIIPKGKYAIEIEKQIAKNGKFNRALISLFILFAIGATTAHVVTKSLTNPSLHKSKFWNGVLNNKNEPTLIVLGDHFFFSADAFDLNKEAIVRYFDMNSNDELDSFLNIYPEFQNKISTIPYTYMTKHGPVCLHTILPKFRNPGNTRIITSSELTFEDIKTKNILFFGSHKSLNKLNNVAMDFNLNFKNENYMGELKKTLPDTIEIERPNTQNTITEYPVVIKSKRSYGNTIMLFICQNDPGNIAALNYMMNQNNIKSLRKLISPDSSIAVFKVNSLGRTDMNIDLVACD